MRRKTIWAWMLCLFLLVCSLSACSLFGDGAGDDAPQDSPSAGSASAIMDEVNAEADGQTDRKDNGTAQAADAAKQTDDASDSEPSADTALPEIEIPIVQAETSEDGDTAADPQSSAVQTQEPAQSTEPASDLDNNGAYVNENGDIELPEIP